MTFIKNAMKEPLLWNRIAAFTIDQPNTSLTFTKRLARDNGWSKVFAKHVMAEYRKFIYLCCISPSAITPSDAVDQAWHLHLTYTKSYWIDMCQNTLHRQIHHDPTKGGTAEQQKYTLCYDQTFALYEKEFGHEPPSDVWLGSQRRFSDIDFKRINIREYWLLPKPPRHQRVALLLSVSAMIISALFIYAKPNIFLILSGIVGLILIFVAFGKRGNGGGGNSSGGSGCSGSFGCSSTDSSDSSDSGCGSSCGSGCGGGGD